MEARTVLTKQSVKLVAIACILIAGTLTLESRANAAAVNVVARFFENGEKQIENQNQCYKLKIALIDMITKSPEQLKALRYENNEGKPHWTITELLSKHYTSTSPFGKTAFYEDFKKKPAKSAIAKQIQLLQSCATYAEVAKKPGSPSKGKESIELDFDKLAQTPKTLRLNDTINSER